MAQGDLSSGERESLAEYWHTVLTGQDVGLARVQRMNAHFPAPPRCKLCRAPFSGPWTPLFRLLGFRRWDLNRQMCSFCIKRIEEHDGGAEIEVSLLFVDIRGSTTLAEAMTPAEFSRILQDFYQVVGETVDSERGAVDHLAGDGVMAMWIPAFVDESHPSHAVRAARATAHKLADMDIPVGIGVHTGEAYVGVVGAPGSRDFTVLGDTANTASRLCSIAPAGSIAMSAVTVAAAGISTDAMEHELLNLKGKAQAVPAWIEAAHDSQA